MNSEQFHQVLIRFEPNFRAFFPALTDEDVRRLLAGPRETLLLVLQERYGYSNAQAKTAWNEFVLRYVDGQTTPVENEILAQQRLNPRRRPAHQPRQRQWLAAFQPAWVRIGCYSLRAKKFNLM